MKALLFCAVFLLAVVPFSFQEREMSETARRHLKSIEAVFNLTIYPNNNYAILTGNLPDVLASNVKARIFDFALELDGPLTVSEYFYGLTPNDFSMFPPIVVIGRVDFLHYMNQGKIAWTVLNYVSFFKETGAFNRNSTLVFNWRFDDDDKIVEINGFVPTYATDFNEGVPAAAFPFYQALLMNETCTRHMTNCLGANQQYASFDACMEFLNSIPFGSPGLNQWNSGTCRWWHSHLTYLRPGFHCPHVGPTGGGVCVDFTSASLFNPFFPDAPDRLIGPPTLVASIP